jgi:hypothetical protein
MQSSAGSSTSAVAGVGPTPVTTSASATAVGTASSSSSPPASNSRALKRGSEGDNKKGGKGGKGGKGSKGGKGGKGHKRVRTGGHPTSTTSGVATISGMDIETVGGTIAGEAPVPPLAPPPASTPLAGAAAAAPASSPSTTPTAGAAAAAATTATAAVVTVEDDSDDDAETDRERIEKVGRNPVVKTEGGNAMVVVGSGAYTGAFFPWSLKGILQSAFDEQQKTGSIRFARRVDKFMITCKDQTVFMVGQGASSGLRHLHLHHAFPRMELKSSDDFNNRRYICAANQIYANTSDQRQAAVKRQVRMLRERCGIVPKEAPIIVGQATVTKVLMCVQCGEEIIPASKSGTIMKDSYNYPSNVQMACLCITTKDSEDPKDVKFCDDAITCKSSVTPKEFIGGEWCNGLDGVYHADCYGMVNSEGLRAYDDRESEPRLTYPSEATLTVHDFPESPASSSDQNLLRIIKDLSLLEKLNISTTKREDELVVREMSRIHKSETDTTIRLWLGRFINQQHNKKKPAPPATTSSYVVRTICVYYKKEELVQAQVCYHTSGFCQGLVEFTFISSAYMTETSKLKQVILTAIAKEAEEKGFTKFGWWCMAPYPHCDYLTVCNSYRSHCQNKLTLFYAALVMMIEARTSFIKTVFPSLASFAEKKK